MSKPFLNTKVVNIQEIEESLSGVLGFNVSEYDTIELTYIGDDIENVIYKKDSEIIATLLLEYNGDGNLEKVSKIS